MIILEKNSGTKGQRQKKVFAKAGLDIELSAKCKHQQRLWLDFHCSTLVHNYNKIFSNGNLYQARQSMNSLPSQILERYV